MKSIDIKSVIIGVLGTILVFVSIGAKSQYEHLSDIVCNSITVLDNGTGGYIKISNSDGKQTSYLGTAENGDGFLTTFNSDGKKTTFLGTAKEGGFGFLTTFNDGKETTFLGTSEGGSGILETFNKYGVMVGYFGSN
ncbi:uncharacterized protein METZ01_LOCUS250525 [marine metagenome]|uniref:Uncharacterized protein n=1 Tax=marine metagenome TaxID=408172 RepID=A0A382IG89_9ZZZZ